MCNWYGVYRDDIDRPSVGTPETMATQPHGRSGLEYARELTVGSDSWALTNQAQFRG
jgi:hypothetical protein